MEESYIFLHREWKDICSLNKDNKIINRKNIENEKGKFEIIEQNNQKIIKIKWDKWNGENHFIFYNEKYYDKIFYDKYLTEYNNKEVQFIYPEWNNIFIIDYNLNKLFDKESIHEYKTFILKENLLIFDNNKFIKFENEFVHENIIKEKIINNLQSKKNNKLEPINKPVNEPVNDMVSNTVGETVNYMENEFVKDTINDKEELTEIEYKKYYITDMYIDKKIDGQELYDSIGHNYINLHNILYHPQFFHFTHEEIYKEFYSLNLPFTIEDKTKKRIVNLVEWGYPPFGGGENWLLDLTKILNKNGYEMFLLCFSNPFKNEYFQKMTYKKLDFIHIIQMPKDTINIIKLLYLLNPDIINHQGVNRKYFMNIANALQIPFVTGFCFWQNIIEFDQHNYNVDMLNKKLTKTAEFEDINQKSYVYVASEFVNDIIFKLYNIRKDVIPTISHNEHFYAPANFQDDNEFSNRKFVTLINCHYNKGGYLIKYLCENIDYNIPLLFVYTENDPNITMEYIQTQLSIRNSKSSKMKSILIKEKIDIKKIYNKTRIVLIPSLCDETFCRVGYEAMNNKIPVLSTYNGNLKYLLEKYAIFINDEFMNSWKYNIENIYFNRENITYLSNNVNPKYNLDIVEKKVCDFFANVSESKFKLDEKNIGLIIPWADQGLGIQGRDYYMTLKVIGYNPHVLSFKPYHATHENPRLQCDDNEWKYPNVHYSESYREYLNINEIIDFIVKYKIKKMIIPEAAYYNIFNIVSVLNLLKVESYLVINIECIKIDELNYHNLFTKILTNNHSSQKILSHMFDKKVSSLGFHLNHPYFKNVKSHSEKKLYNGKRPLKFMCSGGLNSLSRKNINYIIDVFQKINKNYNELQWELNINVLDIEIPNINNNDQESMRNINLCNKKKSYKKIIDDYLDNDIFIHLGTQEGLGLGFYESLYCGTPILTIDWMPNNELIKDGVNGWITPCSFTVNFENTLSIVNKGLISNEELYNKVLEILLDKKGTINIIRKIYNNKHILHESNRELFENNLRNILASST